MPDRTVSFLHRLVLEALPFGMYIVDRDGKAILWSAEFVGHSCQQDLLKHCDAENNPLESAALPLLATLREGRANIRWVAARAIHAKKLHICKYLAGTEIVLPSRRLYIPPRSRKIPRNGSLRSSV